MIDTMPAEYEDELNNWGLTETKDIMTHSNQLAKRNEQLLATGSFQEVQNIGQVMYQSGLFKDLQNQAQAIVKILAGQEYGMPPFSALQNIHIIQGKPTLAANAMAMAIKASAKYDYRVLEMSDERCEIAFFENGQDIGHSDFNRTDAKAAGTQNLHKFARNMLFARAISNGVRWYCPDVFSTAVYTPEEMGAPVDGEGNIVDAPQQNKADDLYVDGIETSSTDVLRAALERMKTEVPTHWQKREIVEELRKRAEALKETEAAPVEEIEAEVVEDEEHDSLAAAATNNGYPLD